MTNHYDYIFTGAGCAGLSLLYRMMNHPFFSDKQILLIDQSLKNKNDRTWCFWETKPGTFEKIVHHRWKQIDFYSNYFSGRFDLLPYEYKMIRGVDFYHYVFDEIKKHQNIHFLQAKAETVKNEDDKAYVLANDNKFSCNYVFNSLLHGEKKIGGLLQHFKGWLIKIREENFDKRIATFMDLRVSQERGTTFVYVLPVAADKALVEYTLFSEALLKDEEYDTALENYLKNYLHIHQFEILEEEFGTIPMTSYNFPKGENNIVNIGTAGGQTKASSGFTFRFIQKHSAAIIDKLVHGKDPHITTSFAHKRFSFYDDVLLKVLQQRKSGDKIFAQLFKKNSPQQILKFLDNETTILEDLKIINSLDTFTFLDAAVRKFLT